MSKQRVLFDLSFAHQSCGYAGIPQEARLMFAALAASDSVDATGLIWSRNANWKRSLANNLGEQAAFLSAHLDRPRPESLSRHALARLANKVYWRLGNYVDSVLTTRYESHYHLYRLNSARFKELIWRKFFHSTVSASARDNLIEKEYALTKLGLPLVNYATLYHLDAPTLDTKDYEFVIFHDSRKISVSQSTTKVIRYHDAVPIFNADTAVQSFDYFLAHYESIVACRNDSIYVCNSPNSLDELAEIAPDAAERATVIPCFVPQLVRANMQKCKFSELALNRISPRSLPRKDTATKLQIIERWMGEEDSVPNYVMSLSTIEPRKNIPGLIRAWERVRVHDPELRLLIVGSLGWNFKESLSAMRPHVASGSILHLEKVAQHELASLYTEARCFVFPSFSEGFGMPPIEAMRCGCPTILSDIPTHRYTAGQASLFFDPYDPEDIEDKMLTALTHDVGNRLRDEGFKNAKRFDDNVVLGTWESFFEKHRGKASRDRTIQD